MKLKRLCAVVLAATMSLTALTGCLKNTEESSGTGTAGQSSTAGTNRETAMGRYVEEEIELPVEAGALEGYFMRMIQRADGRVFLYGLGSDPENMTADILCYEWNGSGWDEQQSKLDGIDLEGSGLGIPSVRQLSDGTEYLAYIDWDTYSSETMTVHSYLIKVTPDGTASMCSGGPIIQGVPDYVNVFSDGSYLFSGYNKAVYYNSDGSRERDIAQGSYYSDVRTLVTAGEGEYITVGLDEASLIRYAVKSGAPEESIPMINTDSYMVGEGALTMDQDGNIYMCCKTGIHFWKKGGSIWETLADGNLSSLSMPSQSVQELALGYDNDYLVLVNDAGGPSIIRFYFDSQVASVPSGVLTIFGLADNATVRQAISMFQKQNPDVRVEFQVGDGGDGSATVTDMIKALNTELVNQKGADILILDGLPIESYIEKGVLTDIGDIVNPLLDDNTLMRTQAEVLKRDGNSVYGVPVRFQYPIMYGTAEGLAAMESLETIRDYDGDLPALVNTNQAEVVKYLMNLYHADLFGEERMIPKDQLVLLLEASKAVYEKGIDPVKGLSEDQINNYNMTSDFGIDIASRMDFYAGETVLSIEMLKGVQHIMLPAEIMKQHNLKPVSANGIFYPSQMVGINASSSNRELAETFIRLLLSEEIQAAELYDGFPVNRQAFESWSVYRNEDTMVGFSSVSDDGVEMELTAVWPTEEQQREIFAVHEQMMTPVINDRVLTEIIIDEAKAYIDGTASAADTADAIINRAALYFAE